MYQEFQIPNNYTDIEQQFKPQQIDQSEKQILASLRQIDISLVQDYKTICQEDNFAFLYKMIKNYSQNIQWRPMKVLEKLSETLHNLISITLKGTMGLTYQDDIPSTRTAFKMTMFLVFYLLNTTAFKKIKTTANQMLQNLSKIEKKNKKNKNQNFQVSKQVLEIQRILVKLLKQSLDINFVLVWQRKTVETNFFRKYTQICVRILESVIGKQQQTAKSLFYILQVILKAQPDLFKTIQIALINIVYENQVPDNLVGFFSKADGPQLQKLCTQTIILIVVYLLQKQNLNSQSLSVKNTKQFLSKLSERLPKLFYNNLSCFIRLYESQSYHLRNAISDILMNILKYVVRGQNQQTVKPRQKFISTLLQRIYDKSSYCRSHVLGILGQLSTQKIVTRSFLILFLKAAIDRVKDNSVNTRKRALQLINTLIDQLCPERLKSLPDIMRQLDLLDLDKQTLQQQEQRIRKILQTVEQAEQLEDLTGQLKIVKKRMKITEDDQIKLLEQRQVAILIANVVDTVQLLLGSKTQTDVLESIRLFIRLNKLNCQKARNVLPHIRLLVFSRQKKIKDEVLSTFINLHISSLKSDEIGQQLVRLFNGATLQDKSALEEILQIILAESQQKGVIIIRPQVFAHLWNTFIQCERDQIKMDEKRYVLTILRVAFCSEPQMVKQQHMESFLNILKKNIEAQVPDFHVIKQISRILMLPNKIILDVSKNFLLALIYILVNSHGKGCNDSQWYSATEHILTAIFYVCENPQKLSEMFLKKLHINLEKQHSSIAVGQFIFTLAHSCLKMLIHLDSIENKIKAKKATQRKPEQQQQELDMVMGGAQAQLQKKLQQIQILSEKILEDPFIARWISIIEKIVQNMGNGDQLETIAVLSYSKFMCISPQYCSKQLPHLLKILTKHKIQPAIKNNIIIAVGDLLHRFPNIVQPYSKNLYQNLHDDDPRVRKTTLTVLTHLSLNDMIKVKSDMCEIAILFQDQNPDIQSLVKQFFHEMYKKDPKNVFNLIPDALARFSNLQLKCNEATFEVFFKNILPMLEKDKYSESLVSKLCERMASSLNMLEVKNTAFCISQLNINEKSLRKILENFQTFRSKFQNQQVQNSFKNLVVKLKKSIKQQHKSLVDELQQKVLHSNEQIFNVDEIKRRNQRNKQRKNPRKRKHQNIIRDGDSRSYYRNQQQQQKQEMQLEPPKTRGKKKNYHNVISEDEQDESEHSQYD